MRMHWVAERAGEANPPLLLLSEFIFVIRADCPMNRSDSGDKKIEDDAVF
jgi:hypothetical protein